MNTTIDENVWTILFSDIETLDDAYRLDDELKKVEQESFTAVTAKANAKTKQVFTDHIKDMVSHKTYEAIRELERKGYITISRPDELRFFFESAHQQILNMPKIQIQLAVEVNEQLLQAIITWVKREIKEHVFIDIIHKPTLLAGCVIVYQGFYKDYSLRTMLHEKSDQIFKPILDGIKGEG